MNNKIRLNVSLDYLNRNELTPYLIADEMSRRTQLWFEVVVIAQAEDVSFYPINDETDAEIMSAWDRMESAETENGM